VSDYQLTVSADQLIVSGQCSTVFFIQLIASAF